MSKAYIEKEAAIGIIANMSVKRIYGDDISRMKVLSAIAAVPAADVKPVVRGEWIGYPECLGISDAYADDQICCSECKAVFSVIDNDTERFNFCPNCGADMRKEANDER